MDTQQILLILIPIIVPYIVATAFALGTQLFHRVIGKLPASQRTILESIANKAVTMAEQKCSSMSGVEKKKCAETAFYAICGHLGVSVPNSAVIDAFIEAAVASLPHATAGTSEDTAKVPALSSARS